MREGWRRERGPQGGNNGVTFSASFCPELTKISHASPPCMSPGLGLLACADSQRPHSPRLHPGPTGSRFPSERTPGARTVGRHAALHDEQTRDCLSTKLIDVHPSLDAAHSVCTCVFFSLQDTNSLVQCRTGEWGRGGSRRGARRRRQEV